ncbi:MAG TPA: type II CAAX endopeptidase family protein [Ktedonosporobacter sp.]|jgi:membrane protease YdiL (CAAX protease family)|nr:type II CAAX endopeptidase family protein [Ktedonosporobacter sp.]
MFLAKTRILEIPLFLAYIFLLFAATVMSDFVIDPYVTHHINNPYLANSLDLLWTLIFRIILPLLYIISVNRCNPLTYLKLTANIGKGALWALAGCLWFALAIGYRHFLQGLPFNHLSFDTWLNMIILVGFFEEIPMRGLLFQKLHEFMGFWQASALSSLLFVCLHFPYWLSIGKSPLYFLSAGLYIFVLACILCFVLKRSGSLWPCIIIHGLNDLLSLIV